MGDLRQSRPRNTTSHRQFVVAVSSNDAEEITPDMWFQRLQELSNDSPERMMGLSIYVGRHHSDPETLAARTFIDALLAYHQGTPPERSTILDFFNYEELAIGEKTVHMYVPLFWYGRKNSLRFKWSINW